MEKQPNGVETGSPLPVADGVDAFGRWLRRERELRGLPREEVARLTKLAPSVVDALESGEAERMPPRAYLLGYLRNYAAVVGLDPDDLVLRWQEIEAGRVDAEPASSPKEVARPRWPRLAIAVALVVALVVGILLALSPCR